MLSVVTPINDEPFSLHNLGTGLDHTTFAGTGHWLPLHGRRVRRIDWILLKDGRRLRTGAHEILRDRDARSGVHPSDHYPVLATLIPAG